MQVQIGATVLGWFGDCRCIPGELDVDLMGRDDVNSYGRGRAACEAVGVANDEFDFISAG